MKKENNRELLEFLRTYQFIVDFGDDYLTVVISDWQGEREEKITLEDVREYFSTCQSLLSGARQLGNIIGDWRNIEDLAYISRRYFEILGHEF